DYRASGTSEPIFAQVLAERWRLAERFGAQPAIFHWHAARHDMVGAAHRWLRKSGADCLIASHAGIYFWLANPGFYGCREFSAVRVPEDMPMVSLRDDSSIAGLAHTCLREREQGIEAVNLVHRHLQQGHLGTPPVPMRMLVPPRFVPGPTLPMRSAQPG
ncbi:MAG: hypothetical protein N2322_02935, partial [Terrimicrobiaceae bacterium]|nr:hypothetical protein [Terrimicrobiaceae bacterium]